MSRRVCVALCLVLCPGAASADDRNYPGSVCVQDDAGYPNVIQSDYTLNWGEFRNPNPSGGGSAFATCPLIHDDFSDGNYAAEVWVYDGGSGVVTCTAYSTDWTTPTSYASASDSSTVSNAREKLEMNVTGAPTNSTFHIYCSVPAATTCGSSTCRSYITSISVDE